MCIRDSPEPTSEETAKRGKGGNSSWLLDTSRLPWFQQHLEPPSASHGSDCQVVRQIPQPHAPNEASIMACPTNTCGMLLAHFESYDDMEMRLRGRLWSVDDRDFWTDKGAVKFELIAHDANKHESKWKSESLHCYRCPGCKKAMALLAVEKPVPAGHRCITVSYTHLTLPTICSV